MRPNKPFPPVRRQPEPEPKPPPSRMELTWRRLGRAYTRFQYIFLTGAGIAIALLALLVYDTARPHTQPLTQRDINAAVARALASATPRPSFASHAYQVIHPSLVRIEARLSNPDPKGGLAVGAGVVIDDTGTVLSSLHIVKDAAQIQVTFADGTESAATIMLRRPENDLVVLHPDVIPDDLMPATLGNSGALRVGDEVLAVGNPFGITNSLTGGVVSGLGRNYNSPKTEESLTNLIQFDAAVNPGNSGGPLLNREGEVVGIVTALFNPTEQDFFVGIGFAVPIETAAGALGSPPY